MYLQTLPMKDMKARGNGFKIKARVGKSPPFESIEIIGGRPRKISCEITDEGRNHLASKGIGYPQLMPYTDKPVELAQFLREVGCVEGNHYKDSRQSIVY